MKSEPVNMVYIFLYNVIYIKSDFINIKSLAADSQLVLIGTPYCFKHLNFVNRSCFSRVHQISRDFHEVDNNEIEILIAGYVKRFGAENIRLLTNEDSAQIICATLREKYHIPGCSVDKILPFVNKVVSKTRLDRVVRLPKFLQFNKSQYAKNKLAYLNKIVNDLGDFPLFAKPIDLVSSVETHKINDFKALSTIADRILGHDYEFEIDEFIDGDLFHCDAMIINGEVKFFMIGKCSFALARFFDGKPVGSIPIANKKMFNTLELFCKQVFKKLKCPDGAYHMEAFWERKSKEFVFLEIGARTGGALISRVYKKVFNINIEETNYLIQMGLINDLKVNHSNVYAGFLNFPTIDGVVIDVIKPEVRMEHEFIEFVVPGERMHQAKNLLDISCSIIFWDKSYAKVETEFEFLKNYNPLKVKPLSN